MNKLLCESIVYCDFLSILLLIVGVLIDNKAFVCLFVCLFKRRANRPTIGAHRPPCESVIRMNRPTKYKCIYRLNYYSRTTGIKRSLF